MNYHKRLQYKLLESLDKKTDNAHKMGFLDIMHLHILFDILWGLKCNII